MTVTSYYHVDLSCGHHFNERRPEGMNSPPGELRTCGDAQHYPLLFGARYTELTETEINDRMYLDKKDTTECPAAQP